MHVTEEDNLSISLFQVAERALFLWNNDHIANLIEHNRRVVLPIIIPALERNAHNHWNQSVLNLSLNIRKMLKELDDELFLSCIAQHKEEETLSSITAEKRKESWERLEHAASLKPMAGKTAVLVTTAISIACYK